MSRLSDRSSENTVMRGKGKGEKLGLSFFVFVSTLPWDKSGVFPGLTDGFFLYRVGRKK